MFVMDSNDFFHKSTDIQFFIMNFLGYNSTTTNLSKKNYMQRTKYESTAFRHRMSKNVVLLQWCFVIGKSSQKLCVRCWKKFLLVMHSKKKVALN